MTCSSLYNPTSISTEARIQISIGKSNLQLKKQPLASQTDGPLIANIVLKLRLFSEIKTGGYKRKECAKIMRNPFMALTNWSVDRPRTAFATILLVVFMLASGAMHLQFDNSEDGFFPDDPSVDLLNEVESEYRSNIDFIRVISDIEEGDMLNQSTWQQLAQIEATMLGDENFTDYHYPLFGTQANNGPAGQAMQWMALHDEVMADVWLSGLETSLLEVLMASDDANLSAALLPPIQCLRLNP